MEIRKLNDYVEISPETIIGKVGLEAPAHVEPSLYRPLMPFLTVISSLKLNFPKAKFPTERFKETAFSQLCEVQRHSCRPIVVRETFDLAKITHFDNYIVVIF